MKLYTKRPYLHVLIAITIVALTIIGVHINAKTEKGTQDALPASTDQQQSVISAPNTDLESSQILDDYYAQKRAEAIAAADEAVSNGDYESAIKAIRGALEMVGEDSELSAKLTILCNEYKIHIAEEAETLYADKGYEAVVELVNAADKLLENENALSGVLKEYQAKYRDETLAEAEETFAAEGYEAAIEVIKAGLLQLSNDAELSAAIAEYKSYQPVRIADVYCMTSLGRDLLKDNSVTDIYGETHSGPCYYSDWPESWGKFFAGRKYLTDQKYNHLTGTIVLPSDEYNTTLVVHMYVYGDGELLYTSPDISGAFAPLEFDVDISGVKELDFQIERYDEVGHTSCIPRVCDLMVSK